MLFILSPNRASHARLPRRSAAKAASGDRIYHDLTADYVDEKQILITELWSPKLQFRSCGAAIWSEDSNRISKLAIRELMRSTDHSAACRM
jgi:hypothetical protein